MKKTLLIIFTIFALPIIAYAVLNGKQEVITEVALASNGKPQVIKFSSPMCSDCQKMAGIIEEIFDDYKNKVEFVEISVNQKTPVVRNQIKKYNVQLVPTMIFIDTNGNQIARVEGAIPKEEFIMYLEQGLGNK